MKITRVAPYLVDPGYGKNWLFVKVETSDGLHGWGECYTQADRDQSIAAHVQQLGRYLLGRDASQIRHFTHWAYHDFAVKRGALDFWSAVSGLEQALWDLAGKRVGLPVVELLGGRCRERVRVYANGWYSGATTPQVGCRRRTRASAGLSPSTPTMPRVASTSCSRSPPAVVQPRRSTAAS